MTTNIDEIKRLGKLLQAFTLFFMILAPVALVILLSMKGPLGMVNVQAERLITHTPLSFIQALPIVLVGLLTPATYLVGFFFIHRLFGLYAKGIVFSTQNITTIRNCGFVLVSVDFVRILQSAITGPVLSSLKITENYFAVDIGFSMLIIGLLVIFISRVMKMGLEIYERDQLTI